MIVQNRLRFVFMLFVGIICAESSKAADVPKNLFDFSQADQAAKWQIVNDGVMGGRSRSQASVTDSGHLRFAGTLSLENNGGFASVRSRPRPLGLTSGETIVMRVKGDGRRYTFNLYTPDRRTAFSYQADFVTKSGEWTEVRLPVRNFVAHSFGRRVEGMGLDPTRVQSIGILLGDKRAGPFEILIDWIRVEFQ